MEEIKCSNGYTNISKAFAHWYLMNAFGLDEQAIAESIIDGIGDNGIDAIVLKDAKLILLQFKFPDKEKT
ncbi:hypothetical protein [Butyrivibrio fibrisolvens]|uniref:hypothetical protein n=1 Tax=Butyrivibrio fibrisolvens TaxID=831 RepID=UPI0004844041|nr:hypothetical protein [Butyrivibrio fibrisolvens]